MNGRLYSLFFLGDLPHWFYFVDVMLRNALLGAIGGALNKDGLMSLERDFSNLSYLSIGDSRTMRCRGEIFFSVLYWCKVAFLTTLLDSSIRLC